MSNTKTRICLAVAVCALLAGCDSTDYTLAPISGVVTLDGSPIPGALVNFQPVAKDGTTPGPGSTGRCDEAGRYVLKTIRDEPGAVIGTHRVRIYSFSPESPVSQDGDAGLPKEQFPDRYNYGSKLTFDVESAGSETADFRLTVAGQ
jgi:hypothetical protein